MKAGINLELFLNKDTSVLQKHIDLLKAVGKTKSITKAASEVGISYKNAWDTLDEINNSSRYPIVIRVQGNSKNSGSEISEYGQKLINNYELIKKAQTSFLEEILKSKDFSEENIANLKRMGMKLSARNQLLVTITEIKTGAVNSHIKAKLSSGEELVASVTIESEKALDLEVGKEVLFIFKAPSIILSKDEKLKISAPNIIEGVIGEVKIGAVNAEVTLLTKGHQTITAQITKESAMNLKLGVNDKIKAIISANNIIIGL